MHFSTVLFLVAISVGCAYAIACPPKFCQTSKCVDEVDENGVCSDGKVKMQTLCNCCTRCVVPISRGGRCSIVFGIPRRPCEDGYHCVHNICEAIN